MDCDVGWTPTVYVSYKVQQGDTLPDLLKKTKMDKREWDLLNPMYLAHLLNQLHLSNRSLNSLTIGAVGDEAVIVDPIATCQAQEWHVQGCVEGISPKWINYRCEESNSAFKPLRAFTKRLWK